MANRGEIAVRIIKTLRKLHIVSVAVFADNDAQALHRRMADEACPLGSGTLKDTYLNIQKIIDAALDAGAEAIHPGYGFLSESPELAEACAANNLIFIGPDAETMRLMGNKIAARQFAIENDIPVTFGITGSIDEILAQADAMPYPVLIKAAAGGGGKGMHIVVSKATLKDELNALLARRRNISETAPFSSSNTLKIRDISKCRSWLTISVMSFICTSANVPSSAVIRKSSRNRLRRL